MKDNRKNIMVDYTTPIAESDFKGFFGVIRAGDGDFEFFKILHG
jgi:hypothetical protein